MNLTIEMLLPLAGILLGAKLASSISHRLGLPAVFGELVLGLMIGPSILGLIAPSETIHLLADIGVIILMFIAGLETDIPAMKKVGKASLLSAMGGVLLPMVGGLGVGLTIGMELQRALFLGAVLTATSVSISAQTLREIGLFHSRIGNTTIGAAIIDDVLGVIVFAVIMSLSGEGNLFLTLGKMAIFFPIAWGIGNKLLPLLLKWESKMQHREASLALIISLLLVYAWAAEELGSVATITGAYLLGVIYARHVDQNHIVHVGIASIGYGFFIPIFFVNVGLQSDLNGLVQTGLFMGILSVFAVLSKIVGSGGGALIGGLSQKESLLVGCGMVSRGEVALVIAGAGLKAGLLDGEIFSLLVFVTLLTTLITPLLLRLANSNISLKNLQKRIGGFPIFPQYITKESVSNPQGVPEDC